MPITAANQYVTLQWIPLELPASTSLVPPPPTTVGSSAASTAGTYNVTWTYAGSQRVNTWHIAWKFANEQTYHNTVTHINRGAQRSAVINTSTSVTSGIDVRVWGSNQSGDGRYAQRTWAGRYSTETAASQTLAASGDIVVSSESWSH